MSTLNSDTDEPEFPAYTGTFSNTTLRKVSGPIVKPQKGMPKPNFPLDDEKTEVDQTVPSKSKQGLSLNIGRPKLPSASSENSFSKLGAKSTTGFSLKSLEKDPVIMNIPEKIGSFTVQKKNSKSSIPATKVSQIIEPIKDATMAQGNSSAYAGSLPGGYLKSIKELMDMHSQIVQDIVAKNQESLHDMFSNQRESEARYHNRVSDILSKYESVTQSSLDKYQELVQTVIPHNIDKENTAEVVVATKSEKSEFEREREAYETALTTIMEKVRGYGIFQRNAEDEVEIVNESIEDFLEASN
jgi:hypothetical protein